MNTFGEKLFCIKLGKNFPNIGCKSLMSNK